VHYLLHKAGGILNTDEFDGNVSRFEGLYTRNREGIYIYLYRSLRDPDLAADILQDTFYNFFRYFKTKEIPDDNDSRKYLYRTARNLVINHYKKSSTQQETQLLREDSVPDTGTGVEEHVTEMMHRELMESILQEALQTLPEKQSSAIILKYYHEFKLDDISQILDISVATVSRMINQGIEKLSKKFENRKKE
jgi:RNA polymerase sigma-70 factor, ECF subfamily